MTYSMNREQSRVAWIIDENGDTYHIPDFDICQRPQPAKAKSGFYARPWQKPWYRPHKPFSVKRLIAEVASDFAATPDEIKGHLRMAHLLAARAIICKVLRQRNWTYGQIGAAVNRDHSTVIYTIANFQRHCAKDDRSMPCYLRVGGVNA